MTRDEITRAARDGGGMFAIIPAIVMRDAALSMSARMLYGVLTWRSNRDSRCWPTNRELGEDLGLSPKRISVLLALLEERGHIEMELVSDPQTGQIVRRYLYPVVKSGRGIPKNEDTPPRDQGDPPPENEEVIGDHKRDHKPDPPIAPQGAAPEPGEAKRRTPKSALTEEAALLLREYVGTDRELEEAFGALMDIRQAKRAVNSARAIRMLLAELERLSGWDRAQKLLLLRQSATNSWKGIFPLKGPQAQAEERTVRRYVE